MSKLTRNDLTRKTRSQLAALFNQVNKALADADRPSVELPVMQSLLAMIRAEQARRDPAP